MLQDAELGFDMHHMFVVGFKLDLEAFENSVGVWIHYWILVLILYFYFLQSRQSKVENVCPKV